MHKSDNRPICKYLDMCLIYTLVLKPSAKYLQCWACREFCKNIMCSILHTFK